MSVEGRMEYRQRTSDACRVPWHVSGLVPAPIRCPASPDPQYTLQQAAVAKLPIMSCHNIYLIPFRGLKLVQFGQFCSLCFESGLFIQ